MIAADLEAKFAYFQRKADATGKLGKTPLQKIVACFRMLGYGLPYDAMAELLGLGEQTAKVCLQTFCKCIIELYHDTYLRTPTKEDVETISAQYAEFGFHGTIFLFFPLSFFYSFFWRGGRHFFRHFFFFHFFAPFSGIKTAIPCEHFFFFAPFLLDKKAGF